MLRASRSISSLAGFALAVACYSQCLPAKASEPATIRVGSEIDFPPYAMLGADKTASGFSVDLFREVAAAVDISPTIRAGEWDAIWRGLQGGEFDALPLVAWSPERARLVDFTSPYLTAKDCFFVRKGAPPIDSIAEATGRKVIVMRGDAAHEQLVARGQSVDVVVTGTIPEAMGLLAAGRYDAVLVPKLLGILVLRQMGLEKSISPGAPLNEYQRDFHIAVARGNDSLRHRLNDGLAIVKASGSYDRVYAEWFGHLEPRRFTLAELFWWIVAISTAAIGGPGLAVIFRRQASLLRAAKLEAEAASAAKTRIMAAVSHDLRQPLHALALYLSVIGNRLDDEDLMGRIDMCFEGLTRLLNDLLAFSKLDSGIITPVIDDVPMADILSMVVVNHAPTAAAKGLDLRSVNTSLRARTDGTLLGQLLGNLVANAIRYTERGGIVIGCRRRPGGIVAIEVWDTGIGIPEESLQQIFEEFYQLNNSERGREKGSGLGLAIVQRLAVLLGHGLRVTSVLGKGSVFAIDLPMVEAASAQRRANSPGACAASG